MPTPLGFASVTAPQLAHYLVDCGMQPAVLCGQWAGLDALVVPDCPLAPKMLGQDPTARCNYSPIRTIAQKSYTSSFSQHYVHSFATGPQQQPEWPPTATVPVPQGEVRVGFVSYPDPVCYGAQGQAGQVLYFTQGQWWSSTAQGAQSAASLLEQAATHPAPAPVVFTFDAGRRQAHTAAVEQCVEAIGRGEVYQSCISTQFCAPVEQASTVAHWWAQKVTATHPAKAALLFSGDGRVVASLSPEVFLERRGRLVRSKPIKGTIPIDQDPAVLAASVKDRAENIMIVDLVRHDLSQVSRSVTVPSVLDIEPAPGVWHLVSTVQADTDVSNEVLMEACFPPASVTGTPKLRARQLISQWEPVSRGIHCGSVWVSWGDVLCANVAIRTAEWWQGNLRWGVGGGITVDSTPDGEWNEILAKSASLRFI